MKLRTKLIKFAKTVADAADRDPEFEAKLNELFGMEQLEQKRPKPASKRPRNRRSAAILDPVLVVKRGESLLREELELLSLEQLRDIVAEFGMDPSKLVMKWKDRSRVIERIVETSLARSQKGDAFRAG
ncbi:hypothetical protein [Roseibium album]|uniref:hypothetical protein n=1 Tax=Roseibium album TaxID=311410 RepID=UPI003BB10C6A